MDVAKVAKVGKETFHYYTRVPSLHWPTITNNGSKLLLSLILPPVRFLVAIDWSVLVVRTSYNSTEFIEDCGFKFTPNIGLLCLFPSAVGTHSMLPR